MDMSKLTQKSQEALQLAQSEAVRRRHTETDGERANQAKHGVGIGCHNRDPRNGCCSNSRPLAYGAAAGDRPN